MSTVKTNVDISDLELYEILDKHQNNLPLTPKERENLWYFLNGWTRSIERKVFGKEDSREKLDLHHSRMLYIHDYFHEFRYRTKGEYCELVNGVPKCRVAYYPDDTKQKPSPWLTLYKLRRYWIRHETIIRLDGLGFDLNDVFEGRDEPYGRNKYELATNNLFLYDIISVMNYVRKTKDYNRDNIIEYATEEGKHAKYTRKFRKSQAFKQLVGVIPFTDNFLRVIAQTKAYVDVNEIESYTSIQLPNEEPWKIVQQLPTQY